VVLAIALISQKWRTNQSPEEFTESRYHYFQKPNKNNPRRGLLLNDISAGCQPQYPDLQGDFKIDSKGVQAVFGTTRHLPALTR
jgi:hypothetical protein